jgi:hypothetical protein
MLGYASDEIVHKQSSTILHLESELIARGRELTEELGKPVEGFNILVEKARSGRYEEREWTYVRKDGETIRVNERSVSSMRTLLFFTSGLSVAGPEQVELRPYHWQWLQVGPLARNRPTF